jgi:hypothetical protein
MFPTPRTHPPDGVLDMRADSVDAEMELLRDLFVRGSSPECSDDLTLALGEAVYAGQFIAALPSPLSRSSVISSSAQVMCAGGSSLPR